MHHRAFSVLAATLAAFALAATPALAGEDDDDGDDHSSSQVQNLPEAPRGGVATGLGGTAPDGPNGLLTAGGLLLTGAGALVAIRRRMA
jgi:hypothetical protein